MFFIGNVEESNENTHLRLSNSRSMIAKENSTINFDDFPKIEIIQKVKALCQLNFSSNLLIL
ncbi:CLUMA_CG003600, isoform A [Clunio marinus]|uniref:CLUMA_CG003600, isoform A n=1 Tax=Clunio marinus TaxID=568069 RepID=A0A1J1HU36_9DIPT|nr:CLUMA_CG003600, isoform A [Clunio marinus]